MPGLATSNLAIIALDQVPAALAYLAAGHPVDGLLLDLTALATEGLDALRVLQAQAPDLPVIVWVSPAQTALGLEAVGAGAQDYLVKGQTLIADLCRAVGCALERHRRQQAIAPPPDTGGDLDTVARQDQRYQKIFQEVPVSLWEEDWSPVMALVRDLQRQGVTDFATYIDQHPEFVTLAMQRVQILDVNQATLDILKAPTKAAIISSLETVFSTPDTLPGFKVELTAFCLGEPAFETEMALRTVTGELIHAWVKATFPDWGSGSGLVLVSLLDISNRVQLEAERTQAEALLTTRIRQQEAVTQLGLAATGASQLGPILQQAVEQVAAVLDVEFCTILELTGELTEQDSQLQLVAGVGWHPDRMDTVTVRLDQASQAQLTLRSPDPIFIDDMGQETRFSATPLLNDYGIVSGMSIAIRVQGKPWGVLGAHSRHPRRFSTDDTCFVQSVVALLALVIERVATQAALGESYQQLRQQATLLTNAERIGHMGSWAFDLTANRLVWSAGTYRLFGFSPDCPVESFEQFLERVVPDDRPKLLAAHRQADTSTQTLAVEYRIRRPDGDIRWLAERGNVEFDAEGRPLRRLGMVMDVTAQKAAEATLQASEERFRLVSRATSDAIWDRDIVANTTWRGEGFKTLFGYGDADLQSPNNWWHSLLHPDDRLRVLASIQTALEGNATSWKDEYRFRCQDGSYAYVMNRGYIIRNAEGQAMRMIGGMLNLTEQKNLEAQLLQSQKMEAIGQLTGGMAHDFNNLLTVIMGNAELLVEQLDAQPQLRSLADMIGMAAQRGADLTQRLLGFARRQTLDPQPVDVNQLIAHMQGLLRRTLGEQIEVRCSCDDLPWLALVDAAQLESALLNLCINARDAMAGVGCLTLTTASVAMAPEGGDRPVNLPPGDLSIGDYVMVAVSDTGAGMAADLLSRVFEPFFTTKDKDKGTGLGLSMVHSFVCQSNGHVTIDSEPGMGTTVRIYLPRCGDRRRLTLEGPALEGARPPEALIYGGDAELILLVEDNALVRDYARQQLESLGYRVFVAENGPAALAMLQQQPDIDLLFTDVLMPGGLNGRELAEAARRLRPQLRVLYTSGYAENVLTHQQGPEAEIQLLPKPYQRAELADKIRQALTGS